MWSQVLVTRWRGRYFLPMATGVSKVARLNYGRNQSEISSRLLWMFKDLSSHAAQFSYRFTASIYHGSSVLLCDGKLHFCCGIAGSYTCVTLTTGFYCHGFHYIYMCIYMHKHARTRIYIDAYTVYKHARTRIYIYIYTLLVCLGIW